MLMSTSKKMQFQIFNQRIGILCVIKHKEKITKIGKKKSFSNMKQYKPPNEIVQLQIKIFRCEAE